jgi:DNA polymerase elongation subunit (family B)
LKILINGGYGLFGNPGFKYADVRVAELITAYGRHTLQLMQDAAVACGFEVVAGDTDIIYMGEMMMAVSDCTSINPVIVGASLCR